MFSSIARVVAADSGRVLATFREAVRGRLAAACALDHWVANGPPGRRAEATAFLALAEFFLREDDAALEVVDHLVRGAIPDGFSEQVLAELAVALAMSGRIEAARLARATYEERVPEKGRWKDLYLLHAVDAFIALAEHGLATRSRPSAAPATPHPGPRRSMASSASHSSGSAPGFGDRRVHPLHRNAVERARRFLGRLADPVLLVPIHLRLASLLMAADRPTAAARHAARVIEICKDADVELRPRLDAARGILDRARASGADPDLHPQRIERGRLGRSRRG